MLIVKLQGGLGNQMFQYAYAKALSLKLESSVLLDISGFKYTKPKYELDVFNVTQDICNNKDIPFYANLHSNFYPLMIVFNELKKRIMRMNPRHYLESTFTFNNSLLDVRDGYIEGYFQTEKYFSDYMQAIRRDFTFRQPLEGKNKDFLQKVEGKNTIAIHVRRGDYLLAKNSYIGLTSLEYYRTAIAMMQERIENPVFVFFSDDIEWVQENLEIVDESYYIDWNTGAKNHEDMRLMSLCRHNIIANSSFSWWGAWLNENPEKIVIAPKRWFHTSAIDSSDVVPVGWIKL